MAINGLLFPIIGGLGLFIFGIKIMGDGLKKAAGEKMRELLSNLTNNRFKGLTLGAIVTSIIQSSSATTVMVVGFVNAGLMTLLQAIPIIIGANIGTTITAQLIAFKITDYALPIVAVGSFMYIFGKKKQTRQIGEAILGFGILFLGLSIMGGAAKTLGKGPAIQNFFSAFSSNPLLGILIGAIATAVVQSSSVTTGIIVIMAGNGLLDLGSAIPLILGTNIGTCITALLASIKTNITAKRAAAAHITFNIMGTIVAIFMIPLYIYIVTSFSSGVERQIANMHTLFNIVNAFLFIGIVPAFSKLIEKIVPGEELIVENGPKYLAKNLINTPSIAIDASRKEIKRAMVISQEMIESAMKAFHNGNRKEIEKVHAREDIVDNLRDAITNYLVKITEKELSVTEAKMVPSLLHTINDIERIGDHAENLADLAERKIDDGLKFSNDAMEEIDRMHVIVKDMSYNIIKSLDGLDKKPTDTVLRKEKELNQNFIKFRETNVARISKKRCNSLSGVLFVDLLANFEKIGDHITNIAQAIRGKLQWDEDDIY